MFIVELILFLLICIFAFVLPGYWLLNYRLISTKFWSEFPLALISGYVFFTLISYFLKFLNLQILIPILILIIDLIYLLKNRFFWLTLFQKVKPFNFLIVFIFAVGVLGQLLIIGPSGSTINGDVVFWSALGRDGSWHLALIQELQKGFPFQNPDFAGSKLYNYHFFSDIPIADFNYFFHFSSLDLFFRFFPLLFSILLGILSFQLGKIIGKTIQAGMWAMIFTFFAGSFGYLLTFFKDQSFGGEAIFWSSQVQSSSGNPPQIIAFIIVLAVFILLADFFKKVSKSLAICLILLIGTLAEFKIYGSVILLGSLLLTSIWYLIKTKRFDLLIIFFFSVILSAILYLPNSSRSENLLLFEPWWFIRTMVVAPDKLNWIDLELRRQTYLFHHNYLRVVELEVEAFLIFLLGNLGMRFLGLWQLIKSGKLFFTNYLSQLMIFTLLISLILPLLFIQKGVPANTIQFFQYFLLIFGILAGVSTAELLQKIKKTSIKIIVSLIIIVLMIPTQVGLLNLFYSRPPFAQISKQELQALDVLKKNSDSKEIILTPSFRKDLEGFSGRPTLPIWIWSDTSYVPAFSSRRVFITDTEQLDIMGYNYHLRQDIQKQIFATEDLAEFEKLLKENHINFIYFPKQQHPVIDLELTSLQKILSNDEIEIWKVN